MKTIKVLLVLNKPNREIPIMESIKREILSINPNALVEIKEMCVPGFNKFVFRFRPDVILTFPFTCIGFSRWYYLFKKFLGSKIISLRAEGVVDFSNEYNVQWAVGFDHYGSSLVDYELFWGEKLANGVGNYLLKQKKISSLDRVKVVGYPRLETYFNDSDRSVPILPLRIKEKIAQYEDRRILLFITGFHLANYSKQDLFDAKDLDAENNLNELLEGVEISKRFRSEWIRYIIQSSIENRDALFIVKKHPIERKEDYEEFSNIRNILFIDEDIQVEEIIPYASVFFHYGSTALVDSYLSKTPSVYVFSNKNKQWYSDLGWPSIYKTEVNEIPVLVKKCLSQTINFVSNSDVESILKDVFNIETGKFYRPSYEIAKILLDSTPAQKINVADICFIKSMLQVVVNPVYWIASVLRKKLNNFLSML